MLGIYFLYDKGPKFSNYQDRSLQTRSDTSAGNIHMCTVPDIILVSPLLLNDWSKSYER